MRFSQKEKYEIIQIVEGSELGVNRTLKELGIHKSTFYNWYSLYVDAGFDGLASKKRSAESQWNRIPEQQRQKVVEYALDWPELSPRELATRITDTQGFFISESSVYRILKCRGLITSPAYMVMKAEDEFKDKTIRVNEMWQTDFTYFKIIGWGWYYLSTVLDDYSRYIVTWELCKNMGSEDAQRSIETALKHTKTHRKGMPRVLSDNGSCYIANDLKEYFQDKGIAHVRGAVRHPQTQGKIERYHRSMKNVVKLENYYYPEDLKIRLEEFIDFYNNERYHESLNNLTPEDVYFGRDKEILRKREFTKQKTIKMRRKLYEEQKLKL
jgi:transposase InsO family protein